MAYQPQIIVIGAGIVGISTAYMLLERGMRKVQVIEQSVTNHSLCTSSSISRLLRLDYGSDALYTKMVHMSLKLWKELELKTRRTLYSETGLLTIGSESDGTIAALEIAQALGLPVEHLSAQCCRQRFPQFQIRDDATLTYNPVGGILHASTCLQTLKHAVLERGGEILENNSVRHILPEQGTRPIGIVLDSGARMYAERIVVAIGPWIHDLLYQLRLPVRLTRQYLLYFSHLPPADVKMGVFPSFMEPELYGFPIHKGSHGWLKIASHAFGSPTSMHTPTELEEPVIAQITQDACRLLPALRHARLEYVEPCVYDVSPDEDFIIDQIPGEPRIVFASGLSGHGFKFGPLIGQILSNLVSETDSEIPLERFRLARFTQQTVAVAHN